MNTEERLATEWFNNLSLEEQFYKTIEANSLIKGDNTRHPHTLTINEILKIYKYNQILTQ